MFEPPKGMHSRIVEGVFYQEVGPFAQLLERIGESMCVGWSSILS